MKTPIAWLENELPLWVKDSLITQENADTLLCRYKVQKHSVSATISTALIIFGAGLIGFGVISLFAYNWEVLSRPLKAVLAIVLLLSAQGFALWTKLCKKGNLGYSEAASLSLFLAFVCSLAIISQAYNMGGDIMDFLMVSTALSIPIVYLFNSRSVAFLLFGAITALIIENNYNFIEHPIAKWGLLCAWLPWYILHLKNHRFANSTVFLNLIFFIGVLLISTSFYSHSRQIMLIMLLTLSSFWMLGVLLYDEQIFYKRVFEILSKAGILIFLIFFCFPDNFFVSEFYSDRDITMFYWLPFMALFALFCYFKKERLFELLLPLSPVIFYFTTAGYIEYYIDMAAYFNLFTAIGAIAMIAGGAKRADIMLANQGLILISIIILIRSFNSDISLLVKGFASILIGVLFIGANIFLKRYLKGKK
jgi:hypothetical protein